ncbi:MAG TPA: type I glyceraldehyde-3-phosphate dehydrogenase [Polyangia bacterium]|jgi:glyceraldehyde 3-phosphate dehydrogenase|nr:type I glyceraldehyde-3-phosphate dehydrogenase [Polyangia bacterium]
MIKIGINGFGRIGRVAFRAAMERRDVEVVAVNDLLELPHLAYLLKHDSVYGRLRHDVAVKDGALVVDGRAVRATAVKDPAESAWGDAGVDVVVESTGIFLTKAKTEAHLRAGAKRVIMSAPSKDDTPVFVYGVNSDAYAGEPIISAASCTTNCLAPIAKVIDETFGLARGLMTTVHATTATQKVVDGVSGKDWRFGRGILENIIPASTGAAEAVTRVLPQLKGKLTGMSFRVPVSDVSVVDLTCQLVREARYEDLCAAMKRASEGPLKGVLGYTDEEVVSTDLRGESCTSVFDAKAGLQLDPTFVKVVAWYDNEWGYASKLLDLAVTIAPR